MNILDEFHKHQDRVLDRLVDGELGQVERRELLAALEDEPGGWRSCALAFLEAQSFRWQFSRLAAAQTLADASSALRETTANSDSARGGFSGRGWWGVCLSVAASLVLAFGLGSRFPTTGSVTAPLEPAGSAPQEHVAASAPEDTDPLTWTDPEDDDLQRVTLALGEGDNADRIELPVAEAGDDAENWLNDSETTLPPGMLERLRAAGFEVVRRQRLYPVELSDGRRLVVPIEEVDIHDPNAAESL